MANITGRSHPRIAFSWYGLPQYAARLMREAIAQLSEPCSVVGSRPLVPVGGIEAALGQAVHWVDPERRLTWLELGLNVPELYFQSGWRYPAFSALGAEVKKAGGKVIGLSDANWRGDLRQVILGAVAFRLRYRSRFDSMLVPGKEGRRLMRWFGFRPDQIHMGMYGADPTLFTRGSSLSARPKRFLFVGQFIARKDVLRLANCFIEFAKDNPDWSLHMCGNGPLAADIPAHPSICVEDFVQPEDLPALFHSARYLILPSLTEAWGLVVHEAASTGCALLLSDRVGSATDLGGSRNLLRFRHGDSPSLLRALKTAAAATSDDLDAAEAESIELAASFGPNRFAMESVELFRRYVLGERRQARLIAGSAPNA